MREYAIRTVYPYTRNCWEFQAFIGGEAMLLDTAGEHPIHAPCICVFAPEVSHGWSARPGARCRVAVVHVTALPAPMEEWLGDRRIVQLALSPGAADRIDKIATDAMDLIGRSDPRSAFRTLRLVADLFVALVDASAPAPALPPEPRTRVDQCLSFWREHLHEGAGIAEAAAALAVSPAHLRRLFHEVLGISPQEALADIRAERAHQLMDPPFNLKREAIAHAVGLSSAPALCRFLKTTHSR